MYINLILCLIIAVISAVVTFIVHFWISINTVLFFSRLFMIIEFSKWLLFLFSDYYKLNKGNLHENEIEKYVTEINGMLLYKKLKFVLILFLLLINSNKPFCLAYVYSTFILELILTLI